jgi:hypothetical protein
LELVPTQHFEIIKIFWTLKCFVFLWQFKYNFLPFQPFFRQNRCQDGSAVVIRRNINDAYTRPLGMWHPWQLCTFSVFHCAPSKMTFLLVDLFYTKRPQTGRCDKGSSLKNERNLMMIVQVSL